jgi:hypothetical protein
MPHIAGILSGFGSKTQYPEEKENDRGSAMDTERPRQRRLAQIAIGACLALGACASQPDRLPIEAGDVCGGQRAELAKFQGYYSGR